MLFLPDEMFKQRDQTIKVHFSKPFDPSILSKDKTHKNWADLIKNLFIQLTSKTVFRLRIILKIKNQLVLKITNNKNHYDC